MSKTIGIDLGTTNSCVSIVEGGHAVIIPNDKGERTTPSVVAFTNDGTRLVGSAAAHQATVNAKRTISSIKRQMGTDWRVNIDGKSWTPQEISAMILRKLRSDAESYLGEPVTDAVLTVPAVGGSYVAYDILSGNIAFDEEDLLVFIENALYLEQDFEWLFKTQPLDIFDDVLLAMLPYLKQVAGLWESLWDFLPYECYTECFDTVDKTECAGLIAKTADFHENVMASFGDSLRKARDLGINVNILAWRTTPDETRTRATPPSRARRRIPTPSSALPPPRAQSSRPGASAFPTAIPARGAYVRTDRTITSPPPWRSTIPAPICRKTRGSWTACTTA